MFIMVFLCLHIHIQAVCLPLVTSNSLIQPTFNRFDRTDVLKHDRTPQFARGNWLKETEKKMRPYTEKKVRIIQFQEFGTTVADQLFCQHIFLNLSQNRLFVSSTKDTGQSIL